MDGIEASIMAAVPVKSRLLNFIHSPISYLYFCGEIAAVLIKRWKGLKAFLFLLLNGEK